MSVRDIIMAAAGAAAAPSAYRYWRLSVTSPTSNVSISEWRYVDSLGTSKSLNGKTIAAIGTGFSPTVHPVTNAINNVMHTIGGGVFDLSSSGSSVWDAYVDMGASTSMTGFELAPQWGTTTTTGNTPTAFTVYGSNTGNSNWVQVAQFSGISADAPGWTHGGYRRFSW